MYETNYSIARQFHNSGTIVQIQPYGSGNVNDTYLVEVEGGQRDRFILQRINQQVFQRPRLIAANLRVFTEHVQARLDREVHERRWETPAIIQADSGADFVEARDSEFWRALTFIDGAETHPTILNSAHAQEAGYALGRFHTLVSDLDPTQLHDTLQGFHITPQYLAHFDQICLQTEIQLTEPSVADGVKFIQRHRHRANLLEEAKAHGTLVQRAIHGDPKVDNILIDKASQQAISLIDLDTVKPGLVHYDVGDCLRSCCNLLGEETDQIEDVRFEIDLCEIILAGYLPVAHSFFSEADYAYLYESIWLITFELGLRFFSDYLAGDVYFKAQHPTHNLQRGLVQFKLAESIASQEAEIRRVIESVRG
ncbi:MAG: aminoglycoside phosphotransferase family protein [Chloroflexota bacterium]